MVEISDIIGNADVARKLEVDSSTPVFSAKWIKYNGTEYRRNFVICIAVQNDMPFFCKIKFIVVRDDDVLFCGLLMQSVCFHEQFYSFEVKLHPDRVVKVLMQMKSFILSHLKFR